MSKFAHEELEATAAPGDGEDDNNGFDLADYASEKEALDEAETVMAKSETLCAKRDPEEEPFKSKYLAREALKHAITRLEPYADSPLALSTAARLQWRIGSICMDVEETGQSVHHFKAALQLWRPQIVDAIEALPFDAVTGSTKEEKERAKFEAGGGHEDDKKLVAQLLEYCLEKEKSEEGGALHVPMEVVEAISHLGIYYHNFEHYRHGLILLQLAEQLMNHMDQRTSDKSKSESTDGAVNVLSNGGSSAVKVNSARTHVMFYLAQAYAALHHADEAAHYCQQTLTLQLSHASLGGGKGSGATSTADEDAQFYGHGSPEAATAFNPLEWYRNCSGLVDYFVGQDRYRDAEHCLLACDAVIATHLAVPPPPASSRAIQAAREVQEEAKADMERRWGVVYLNILQDAGRWKEAMARANAQAEKLPDKDEREGVLAELAIDDRQMHPQKVFFSELNLPPPTMPLPTEIQSFDSAREVFKLGMARHTKAKEFYVLDGYVTDYVALCKNVSHLYRWLLVFEDDEKRQTAMMARRVSELVPILDQLGTNAYNDTLKQLAFEVGEIYMEMTELKMDRMAAKKTANPHTYVPKPAEVAKCNEYCQASIDAFTRFTDLFRRKKPVPLFDPALLNRNKKDEESDEETEYDDAEDRARKAKKRAEKALKKEEDELGVLEIPDDELAVNLRAHFYVARMLGKLLPTPSASSAATGGSKARVEGLVKSLAKYEWLAKFARERLAALPKQPKPLSILDDPESPPEFVDPNACFKEELQMCDQMIELLPLQIARMNQN